MKNYEEYQAYIEELEDYYYKKQLEIEQPIDKDYLQQLINKALKK